VFAALHRRRERRAAALAAYTRIVERAREPAFYLGWGVPDTLDGRFEVLALHVFLVLNRLKGAATRELRKRGLVSEAQKIWSSHGSTVYLWTESEVESAWTYVVNGQGRPIH